jgi:hypothetical protein
VRDGCADDLMWRMEAAKAPRELKRDEFSSKRQAIDLTRSPIQMKAIPL